MIISSVDMGLSKGPGLSGFHWIRLVVSIEALRGAPPGVPTLDLVGSLGSSLLDFLDAFLAEGEPA